MSLNTVLHWLVSQALFVVEILSNQQNKPEEFYLNYSPLAIFCVGLTSTLLIAGITTYYLIPIKTWMPLMGGSLRVVFESCRRIGPVIPLGGLMWGDISTKKE
jgi:hypothetical protein